VKRINCSTQHLQHLAMLSPDSISALLSSNDTPTKRVRKMRYAIPKGSLVLLKKKGLSYANH
jgi:hypothetical protein